MGVKHKKNEAINKLSPIELDAYINDMKIEINKRQDTIMAEILFY